MLVSQSLGQQGNGWPFLFKNSKDALIKLEEII